MDIRRTHRQRIRNIKQQKKLLSDVEAIMNEVDTLSSPNREQRFVELVFQNILAVEEVSHRAQGERSAA